MAWQRGIDGDDALDPVGSGAAGVEHLHRVVRRTHVAEGTLACPDCDAPVSPVGRMRPADPIACPICGLAGAVREFLSLRAPTRPARVVVRLAGLDGATRSVAPPS